MAQVVSSSVVGLPLGRVGTNDSALPATAPPATPSQESQTGSGVEERTLLKPNNDPRRDTLPSLTLQSERNSKRGWLTSKSRKIASAARQTTPSMSREAIAPPAGRQDAPKPPKTVPAPKDHAKPLENQPSTGVSLSDSESGRKGWLTVVADLRPLGLYLV